MRLALVAEAFQARTPYDTSSHVRSLAPALARAGVSVEVFAGTHGSGVPAYCQRRTEVSDHVSSSSGVASFGVTLVELDGSGEADRLAIAFGAFLDRERPDICHFEHLHVFGVGLVREAKRRGIATLYAAGDTWPAHDRTTLTLPDLSPFELGDSEAEARALAAEALVQSARAAGETDEAGLRTSLEGWLHGPMSRPDEVAAMRDARETIEARRAEKRVALSAVDRRFAASRMLSKELSAAVGRAFTFRAPGVDVALVQAAAGAAPAAAKAGGPNLLYCGATNPTTGIDVLLDAFERLQREAAGSLDRMATADVAAGTEADGGSAEASSKHVSLHLLLTRTNEADDARVVRRVEVLSQGLRVGQLTITCSFEHEVAHSAAGAVASAVTNCDALVLPTLWGEVAPSIVRFALAVGRPILASRMPGVLEAVPQTSGAFVTPGDVDAWANALRDFDVQGPMAVSARAGIRTGTKSVDDEAVEWMDTYEQLTSSAPTPAAARTLAQVGRSSLAHVNEVESELEQLSNLSVAELFGKAQDGIAQLRQAFGIEDGEMELMQRVIARGGAVRDRAEHDARTRKDVARALETLDAARGAMRAEEESRARRVADLQAVLSAYEQEVVARGAAAAESAQQLEASKAQLQAAQSQAQAAESQAQAAEGKAQTAERQAQTAESQAEQSAAQVEEMTAQAAAAESKARASSARAKELEQKVAGAQAALNEELAAFDRKESELRETVADLEAKVSRLDERSQGAEGLRDELEAERDAALSDRDAIRQQLRDLEVERERIDGESQTLQGRVDAVTAQAEAARSALAEVEDERERMASSIREREDEIRDLRDGMTKVAGRVSNAVAEVKGNGANGTGEVEADLETIESYCAALERDVEALRRHDAWIQEEATRLVGRLAYAARLGQHDGERADGDDHADAAKAAVGSGTKAEDRDVLTAHLARGAASLDSLVQELEWRRREMQAARSASNSLRSRFLGSPLAARVRQWDGGPPVAASSGSPGATGTATDTKPVASEAAAAPDPPAPLPTAQSAPGKPAAESAVSDASDHAAEAS